MVCTGRTLAVVGRGPVWFDLVADDFHNLTSFALDLYSNSLNLVVGYGSEFQQTLR